MPQDFDIPMKIKAVERFLLIAKWSEDGSANRTMRAWDAFEHNDAYDDLKAIVETATAMGARAGSCGERKISIQWPDGVVVHIRRFVGGRFRWLLFSQEDARAVFLADRDPSLGELKVADAIAPRPH